LYRRRNQEQTNGCGSRKVTTPREKNKDEPKALLQVVLDAEGPRRKTYISRMKPATGESKKKCRAARSTK